MTGSPPLRSVALMVLVLGCTSPSTVSPSTTAGPTTSRSVSSVTTSSSTTVPATDAVPAPTVIVPQRNDGLVALDLDPDDLTDVTVLVPEVVRLLPHDRTAVTEGLSLLSSDLLLESTGLYGRSSRRLLDASTGTLLTVEQLRPELYATGVAAVAAGVGIQLTEREELVQLFNTETLALIEERSIDLELSGVCRSGDDGPLLVSTSDGLLHSLAIEDLRLLDTVSPRIGDTTVPPLTDLTCVGDSIWGVVADTAVLVRIEPVDGAATAVADLAELTPAGLAANDVLAGTAYRPGSDSWFVTGRRWDVLYEIQLRP